MNDLAQTLITQLNLTPHPEGGFYREMFRSDMTVQSATHGEVRAAFTTIYFLLDGNSHSAWHRITADESWFFHTGCDLEIYTLAPEWQPGSSPLLATQTIGTTVGCFQVTIPRGHWFAAKPKDPNGFCLVSCAVGPGFEFKDFECASRSMLLERGYQHCAEWPHIESLLICDK